jgi:hypothetical protein
MKVAVINFSGNVGKSTVARHLLCPRIAGAELIAVESVNAHEGAGKALRGRQFADLQEYLQTIDNVVVDIGASNVEELLSLMQQYQGSQEDFDCYVVPTVPALKQQKDTASTLAELAGLGVPASRLKVVFNMVEDHTDFNRSFHGLLDFLSEHPIASANPRCRLASNEIYARVRSAGMDLQALVDDQTDYKALIAASKTTADKFSLAQKLATRRLASGVLPELDVCFAALQLGVDATGKAVAWGAVA